MKHYTNKNTMFSEAYVSYRRNMSQTFLHGTIESNCSNFMSTFVLDDTKNIALVHESREHYSTFMCLFAKSIMPIAL